MAFTFPARKNASRCPRWIVLIVSSYSDLMAVSKGLYALTYSMIWNEWKCGFACVNWLQFALIPLSTITWIPVGIFIWHKIEHVLPLKCQTSIQHNALIGLNNHMGCIWKAYDFQIHMMYNVCCFKFKWWNLCVFIQTFPVSFYRFHYMWDFKFFGEYFVQISRTPSH